jgi:hypothetical protein
MKPVDVMYTHNTYHGAERRMFQPATSQPERLASLRFTKTITPIYHEFFPKLCILTNSKYRPPLCNSSECVPLSTILPWSNT